MGKKKPTKKKRRYQPTAAEERRVDQMIRRQYPQVFAFSDRLAELEKDYGISPKRVRGILADPLEPLGEWQDLEVELRQAREELRHVLGMSREVVQARIVRLEEQQAAVGQRVRLGLKRRWTKPPSQRFWLNAPVDIPDAEWWLNPRRWPWLQQRAAALADYLRTTRLVNPKRPWRLGTAGRTGTGRYSKPVLEETARLIWLFYRFYFRRLVFTAKDVKLALDTYPLETASH